MSTSADEDAAEYVLGTLPASDRIAFAARLDTDPAARDAVLAWERRLGDLSTPIAPVVPPQTVWAGIERALDESGGSVPRLRVVEGGAPDLVPQLRRTLSRWRAATLAASGLAAALAVYVGVQELSPRSDAGSYVAAVSRGGDRPALLVRVDLQTHRITVVPVAAEAPAGKSLQLWYIGAGQQPRSMGLVDRAAKSAPLPDGVDAEAATFAVSIEPQGGSPGKGPTGPVAYSGQLIRE